MLDPMLVSRDLINPAPPVVANGVVFALEEGNPPATPGSMLSMQPPVSNYTPAETRSNLQPSPGVSVGDAHAFFTTHDNTLYCFGIPMEH